MAVYQITYKDKYGDVLLEAMFNADGPKEGLQIMISTPSLAPPAGTVTIEVADVTEP